MPLCPSPDCGKKHRAQVSVPDVRSRVLLLREGLGRPAQAEEPSVPQLPDSVEAIRAMDWRDLQAVFALQFAGDITTVRAGETASVIRQRISQLEGRAILREALHELEHRECGRVREGVPTPALTVEGAGPGRGGGRS